MHALLPGVQTALKTSKKSNKKDSAAPTLTEEEEAMLKSGGNSNKTVKFDNLVNPKTLKAFDKKNVSEGGKRRIKLLYVHDKLEASNVLRE